MITKKAMFATKAGVLYITGTPIGNLSDITIRAIEVLRQVDFIICEDTRKTANLLNHYNIRTKLFVYNDHATSEQRAKYIKMIQSGMCAALVSDAGMPLIADPGYKLVRAAIEGDIEISVIPGPSAVISALSLSGLASDRFTFYGFLPTKASARFKLIHELQVSPYTSIMFETTKRLVNLLEAIKNVMPDRPISIAREMTKLFEEVYRGSVTDAHAWAQNHLNLKGELVLVLEGGYDQSKTDINRAKLMAIELLKSSSIKNTVAELTTKFDLPKKELYDLCLTLKNPDGTPH
jgi:16S rRNA (cytidine1402-2'-O)-methyltransferase